MGVGRLCKYKPDESNTNEQIDIEHSNGRTTYASNNILNKTSDDNSPTKTKDVDF